MLRMFTRAAWMLWLLLVLPAARAGDERVTLIRTPEGGIQPQVAMDDKGVDFTCRVG